MASFTPKIVPPDGIVKLSNKQMPVCETKEPFESYYGFTRAKIDISNFKQKLKALCPEDWEDENQEGNVRLTRPAHDAWGIKKIVFNFCDDFLLKVLDLPWSRKDEWRELLLPVYEAMGIDESKVVRCLLASMPPGVSIPPHHDTGYWVKHTHRCHLPIITDENVDFLIGPTNEKMEKYLFDEGRIVELNNQAKHAVYNNSSINRVHLIFDYVDDHPITRHQLQPGEVVYQTRRSIDLAKEVANAKQARKNPNFIIIGAQKCGTTSLYEYICQHPLVVRGRRRETHYFDWRYNSKIPDSDAAAHHKYYMNFFHDKELQKHLSLVTGESTPSYLLHSDLVIPRMQRICPWAKVLIMLRNPVDRAFSQYQMCIDTEGTPEQLQTRGQSAYCKMTFEQVIRSEIQELRDAGITPGVDFKVFQQRILSKCPMTHGGHSIVARGLYCLQIAEWQKRWPADQLRIMSIADLKGDKKKIQENLDGVFQFIGIPPSDIEDIAAKNTRSYEKISLEHRALLEDFYNPFNDRLVELLGCSDIVQNW